jgi:hypothetical protein
VGVLNVLERRVKIENRAREIAPRTLPSLVDGIQTSIELLSEAKKKHKTEFRSTASQCGIEKVGGKAIKQGIFRIRNAF